MSAGSPWCSHPTNPGIESPFFIPVPSKSQCLSWMHVQSATPLNGNVERAPINVAGLGPCSFHFPSNRLMSGSVIPNLPMREIDRLGPPATLGENSIRPSQLFPLKKAAFTPAATADLTWLNISNDQYSS